MTERGSTAITAMSNTASTDGSTHCWPSRMLSGKSTVSTIAATIAPTIGQRASAAAGSRRKGSIRRILGPQLPM